MPRHLLRQLAAIGLSSIYDYGAPSGSGGDGSSTGVQAQWIFDEVSGSLVDVVNGITLTVVGTPVFREPIVDSDFAMLTPGVKYAYNSSNFHHKTGVEVLLDMDVDDATWEAVHENDGGASTTITWLDTRDPSTLEGYAFGSTSPATGKIDMWFKADDGTLVSGSVVTGKDLTDSSTRKLRCPIDRSGNAEGLIDGAGGAAFSMAALIGKNIKANGVVMGDRQETAGTEMAGTTFEMRMTIGGDAPGIDSGGPVEVEWSEVFWGPPASMVF